MHIDKVSFNGQDNHERLLVQALDGQVAIEVPRIFKLRINTVDITASETNKPAGPIGGQNRIVTTWVANFGGSRSERMK